MPEIGDDKAVTHACLPFARSGHIVGGLRPARNGDNGTPTAAMRGPLMPPAPES